MSSPASDSTDESSSSSPSTQSASSMTSSESETGTESTTTSQTFDSAYTSVQASSPTVSDTNTTDSFTADFICLLSSFRIRTERDCKIDFSAGPLPPAEHTCVLELDPPLITPETIQHIAQAPRPYPVYHALTVHDNDVEQSVKEMMNPRLPPDLPTTVARANFKPRSIAYVIIPGWRWNNIVRKWFRNQGLYPETLTFDEHAVPYSPMPGYCKGDGQRKPCRVTQPIVGDPIRLGPHRAPNKERVRELLEFIEAEKEAESRGIWKRENCHGIHCESDVYEGYGPNNW